jgi:cell division protein FtsB
MKIQINTTDLDNLEKQMNNYLSVEKNFFSFDIRFGQDSQIEFNDFLMNLDILEENFGKIKEGKEKQFEAIQDFCAEEFNAGFLAGFETLKNWVEKKALNNWAVDLDFFKVEKRASLEELQNQRNKLNRQIATLKKANLK